MAENPLLDTPKIYHTAKIFKRPSKYVFNVVEQGTHAVRLHFHRFNSSKLDFDDALFHVLVNGYVVLSNFSCAETFCPRVKEFLIWVDSEKLVVTFLPSNRKKFAFVNAIEVISAPKDLISDSAKFVNGDKIENLNGLNKKALEAVFRVNVGGPKVTPFNDSLWRTWFPDSEFLKSGEGTDEVYSSGRIRYQSGGASREIAPDNVYNTARVLTSKNASIPNVNITLEFPVVDGYRYLVRTHFCDIASVSLGFLYFNVYVNGHLAYKDLDMTDVANNALSAPFYADFVVDGVGNLGVLSVSIGASSKSMEYTVDGILNGVEVMKMSNSMGSFDGDLSAELILKGWPRENVGVLIPFLAVVCLFLGISMVLHRKMVAGKHSVEWSKLPVDVSQVDLKHWNQAGKL